MQIRGYIKESSSMMEKLQASGDPVSLFYIYFQFFTFFDLLLVRTKDAIFLLKSGNIGLSSSTFLNTSH